MDNQNMPEKFDNGFRNVMSFVDNNQYVTATLSLFLILYATFAAPRLPRSIAVLFDNPLFRLLIFFLIVYVARKNVTVAVVAALAIMISIQTLHVIKVNDKMVSMVRENYSNNMHSSPMDMEELPPMNEVNIPEQVLTELGSESKDGPTLVPTGTPGPTASGMCKKKFRNEFYPQYVNEDMGSYKARYTGSEVQAYDAHAGEYSERNPTL